LSNASDGILLESGTNELELLEFKISGNSFGINVAKITELMQAQPPQVMPNSHPCIEGIFQTRADIYTVVNLPLYLNLSKSDNPDKDIYIITSFNQMNAAFHIHSVVGISRISWTAIEKPDIIVYGGEDGVVTGIARIGDRIISILDFEKITYDISPGTGIQMEDLGKYASQGKMTSPILISEDSSLMRRMILESLEQSGYSNTIVTTNGQEAWAFLQDVKSRTNVPLLDQVCCVITDIEMPQLDGSRLTKLIKTDPILNVLPVIMFSSLIDENMRTKGFELGADAMLAKPDIGKLIDVLNDFLI